MEKRGQVTIFIIIGIFIVVAAILIFLFFPKIQQTFGFGAKDPSGFMQTCLKGEIQDAVEKLSVQGGSIEPELFYLYQDNKIEYLCYTTEYYQTCVMQQPMLKAHIENEIKEQVKEKARECLQNLKSNYESKSYDVALSGGEVEIELLPKRIVARFNNSLTLRKEGSSTSDKIEVVVVNNLYELVSIANSILNFETRLGDSETTVYMNYYHDLKVEKLVQTDGTKIYILTDRNTDEKFQFATRSLAWPPGYAADQVIV